MKKLLKTTITLAAIGVAVKVIKNKPSIKNATVTNIPVQKITGPSKVTITKKGIMTTK